MKPGTHVPHSERFLFIVSGQGHPFMGSHEVLDPSLSAPVLMFPMCWCQVYFEK